MKEHLEQIPISDIHTNPYQPRQSFETEALDALAASIKENGLIQPIIVRQSPIYGYELVAGERRLRACQIAGLTHISAIIRPISDQVSQVHALIENIQRYDLTPIEEAKAIQQLAEKNHITHAEIAQLLGKSRPYVTNSLRLLQLAPTLQEAIEHKQLSPGHARLLIGLDQKDQEHWLRRIQNEELSVRAVENFLKKNELPSRHTLSKEKKQENIFVQEIEQDLKQTLGLPVDISYKDKTQTGQVTISFKSLQEFEKLIHILKK